LGVLTALCVAAASSGLTGTAIAAGGAVPQALGGGQVGSATEAPWSVRIQAIRTGSPLEGVCTGSIIDPTHVLTAGHCTYDEEVPWTSFEVRAGVTKLSPAGQPTEQHRQVVALRRHPGYKPGGYAYDVAILTVEPPFAFSGPAVQPIPVAAVGGAPALGSTVEFFGWGETGPEVQSTEEHSLQQTTIPQWRCGGALQGVPSFACGESSTGSACPGDSGSGVVSGTPPALVAIVTLTANCAAGAITSGPALTTPEMSAWLAGSESPPLAPVAETLPTIATAGRAGEPVECRAGKWTGSPTLESELVEPATGAVLARGTSAVMQLPVSAAGQEVACVSLAANAGGTTEARSAESFTVGPPRPVLRAASRVRVIKLVGRGGRWHLVLAVTSPEVGRRAHLAWTAKHCRSCRATGSVKLRGRTAVASPSIGARRLAKAGPWTLDVSVPGAETAAAVYAAGVKKVRLGRLAAPHRHRRASAR
jgi:hypothetical protein